MVKTQVQIPDELFKQAKTLAAEKEWSFAEVVRRGLEKMVSTHPVGRTPAKKWKLPPVYDMGEFLAPEDEWTELSHE